MKMISSLSFFFDLSSALIFALVLVIGLWLFRDDKRKKFPPGPMGLPIVGYLPFLGKKPYITLLELKKKYGPVYSLRIGSQLTVVLADYPSMKEAFSKDAFIGRPPDETLLLTKETLETMAFTGLPWKELKRFSLHVFRDLGLGKTRLEIHIAEEIKELLERIEEAKGKLICPKEFIAPSVANNVASLVFGKRKKYDDPQTIFFTEFLNKATELAQTVVFLEFFPIIKRVVELFGLSKRQELVSEFDKVIQYIKSEVQDHINTFNPDIMRDYIDRFLVEIEKQKANPKSVFILPVLYDLATTFFGAGTQTVRSAMDWLLLISAARPDIQKKVQSEIDDVIGNERFPARSDYLQMPYTEATIMEILRWRAFLPLSFLRYTIDETQVGTYTIPKHVRVLGVNWAVHHDPDLWGEDVDQFRPERFLSEDGKKIQKPEYYIPFSIGKRSCPGESLAYVEIFMYFTAILRKFNVRLPDGVKSDFDGYLSFGLEARPYQLHFDLR